MDNQPISIKMITRSISNGFVSEGLVHEPNSRHVSKAVLSCHTCVTGRGHAAADHSRNVPFGVEKRRQCLQLPGGGEASIDASSQAYVYFRKREKTCQVIIFVVINGVVKSTSDWRKVYESERRLK